MFWGKCVCIQSQRKTAPSASSVFANLETLIGKKNKIIHSYGHDIEPPVLTKPDLVVSFHFDGNLPSLYINKLYGGFCD